MPCSAAFTAAQAASIAASPASAGVSPIQMAVSSNDTTLAHAPNALHEKITADYNDMIYAENAAEVMRRRQRFLAKWRLKCRGVADRA